MNRYRPFGSGRKSVQRPKAGLVQKTLHEPALLIHDLSHDGKGVGRDKNGRIWFVSGALPGELVSVISTRVQSRQIHAKLKNIIEPSSERVVPRCPVYDRCGGCSLQHLEYKAQVHYKQVWLTKELNRQTGKSPLNWVEPLVSDDKGYRVRARMAIDLGRACFTGRQTNHRVPVDQCLVLTSNLNKVLANWPELPIAKGDMELLEDDNGLVGIHLLPAKSVNQDMLLLVAEKLSPLIQGLWLTQPGKPVKELFSDLMYLHHSDWSGCFEVPVKPWHFVQANRALNRKMVSQAIDWLEVVEGDKILDLFAGSGNFSFPVHERGAKVLAIESAGEAVESGNGVCRRESLTGIGFQVGNLFDDSWRQLLKEQEFNKILLDPPRAGAALLSKSLGDLSPLRLVYVSCNPATLARDAASLLEQGYEMVRGGIIDMFPHTSHVESMLLFEKIR